MYLNLIYCSESELLWLSDNVTVQTCIMKLGATREACNPNHQGPVARSLVSTNRWLRGIKMYRFPWYLTLVSTNHTSSNPGQVAITQMHGIYVASIHMEFHEE